MGGSSLSLGVLILVNPLLHAHDASRFEVRAVPRQISYAQSISDPVSLYTPSASASQIAGMVYVPQPANACSQGVVPANATHYQSIPPGFNFIAFAPLTDSSCSTSFLQQAQLDGASAIVFYNTTNAPSPSGGLDYHMIKFPVYQITSTESHNVLDALVAYNANMTEVPMSQNLTQLYDWRDYPRVSMQLSSGNSNPILGLWLFLVIVLAVLCFLIGMTSLIMHIVQYYYRRDLRRRIEAGEINLESVGIKKMTVPKEILESFTVRLYDAAREQKGSTSTPPVPESTSDPSAQQIQSQGFGQQSCPICLDDFEQGQSLIRELPCRHIFHPHCVDPFLETRSSLCPLCKQSALPKGYLPHYFQLTNATVSRERRLGRRQQPARSENVHAWERWRRAPVNTYEMGRYGDHAPTQEEEDAEELRRSSARRFLRRVFPVI